MSGYIIGLKAIETLQVSCNLQITTVLKHKQFTKHETHTGKKKKRKKKEGLGAFISISRYLRHQIKFWSLLFLGFYMKLHGKSLKFSH